MTPLEQFLEALEKVSWGELPFTTLKKMILELEAALNEGRELVDHARCMGNFTPDGSTEGWALEWLRSSSQALKRMGRS